MRSLRNVERPGSHNDAIGALACVYQEFKLLFFQLDIVEIPTEGL